MDFFKILKGDVGLGMSNFDRLFAEKHGGGAWQHTTLTGALPLSFNSKGTPLTDYKLYGTAEGAGERTKNLMSVSNVMADTGVTIVDADEATGSLKLSASVRYRGGRFDFNFEDGKTYTISAINNVAVSNARMAFRVVGTNAIISSVSLSTAGVKTVTLTFSSIDYPDGVYVSLICNMSADGVTRTVDLSNLMLIEGSTMLTDFIPYGYQIPISVQGRNLFDKTATDVAKGFEKKHYIKSNGSTVGNANWNISEYLNVQSSAKYMLIYGSNNETPAVCYYTSEKEYISGVAYNNQPIIVLDTPINAKYIRFSYMHSENVNPILQKVLNYNIYIGDSKLLSDDYIDYESGKIVRNGTPQDPPLPLPAIETFKGTNTLDSTETVGEVTIKGQIKPQS